MTLNNFKEGDLAECKKNGRTFIARVRENPSNGVLVVDPITPGFNYHHLKAREVSARFKRCKS